MNRRLEKLQRDLSRVRKTIRQLHKCKRKKSLTNPQFEQLKRKVFEEGQIIEEMEKFKNDFPDLYECEFCDFKTKVISIGLRDKCPKCKGSGFHKYFPDLTPS